MGVQTQFEGVWERIEDPNDYFTVYCWCVAPPAACTQAHQLYVQTSTPRTPHQAGHVQRMPAPRQSTAAAYEAPAIAACWLTSTCYAARYISGGGQDLCQGGVDVSFTNFTWPMGTKYDRGINISFTSDITLSPGSSISTSGGSTQVMLSFKDASHAFRLDVSDLGIDGALNCPEDVQYETYPPPDPPAPKPCTAGPDPYRGCPSLEWYFNSPMVSRNLALCLAWPHAHALAPAGGAALALALACSSLLSMPARNRCLPAWQCMPVCLPPACICH